jgi:isochorismate synthase
VFAGASPERLVRIDGREVRASGLAGSAPRGKTADEDAAIAAALLANAKEREEHAMVRRALLADLAELCDDVVAPAEPSLFTLPHVHHLHTALSARLRAGHSLLDLVARLHPTPAVGGAPRDAALQFIREHEGLDRGWYAAPIGWIGRDHGELAVALRSALVRGREAWLFAGSGVVADSDPAREYAETMLKLRPMELALVAALVADGAGAAAESVPAGAGDAGAR